MKKILILLLLVTSSIVVLSNNHSSERKERVSRAILCEDIKEREPLAKKEKFKLGERATLFSEILNSDTEDYIYHVWSTKNGDKTTEISRVKLKVSGPRWRTWSNKYLSKTGVWEVKIVDSNNNILIKKEFEVTRGE
ncbi:MAG: DUF2914 domain-containing protein [Fusobacteriota bacterium]